ncbi:MAG: hypothetical protein QNK37_16660 [Acidobacteriota bacterium]|nr:hypothetical protein [Acidobacteriota bacterium]
MVEHEDDPEIDEDMDEFVVVELESEDGEVEEFVIIDRFEVENAVYCVMAALEDVEAAEDMTKEEMDEVYGEDGFLFLMREDGEDYVEMTEEENQQVKEAMERKLEALSETMDGDGEAGDEA